MDIKKCPECHAQLEDEDFWETHQTMSDGHIWCVNKKIKDMTKLIVMKAKTEVNMKYGNKKRHRQ